MYRMIAWNICLTNRGVKLTKKTKQLGGGIQNWARNWGFSHFLKFALLVFLEIAQDCSLETCPKHNRAETSKN